MDIDNIKVFLPKYLSDDSEKALVKAIRDFPSCENKSFYTDRLKDQSIIFQGDGIDDFPIFNVPKDLNDQIDRKTTSAIILSNTCDLDLQNKRYFASNIVYAPIVLLSRYKEILISENKSATQINTHFDSIRNQEITQIFFLPSCLSKVEESIVFLDKVFNLPNSFFNRSNIGSLRRFTLSDFGSYLFLFKLSLHFTRIQDRVDRGTL